MAPENPIQQEEGVEDYNVAAVDMFVAGETISQIAESQVLIKPNDAVHPSEEEDAPSDKEIFSVTSKNVSMAAQLSEVLHDDGEFDRADADEQLVKHKRAKISQSGESSVLQTQQQPGSPDLPHKLPARVRSIQEEDMSDEGSDGVREGEHTNMFGISHVMWFDLGIEGKSAMDREEQDWGGRLEFGFSDVSFPKEVQDYFILFEDPCSSQAHICGGRVSAVVSNMRDKLLKPPSYDPRNIEDLLDRYGDAHISDTGWREVDTEEWVV